MKYSVTVISNYNSVEFESDSRNSIQHLRNHGGYRCIIRNKSNKVISAAEYSETFGFYHIGWAD